MIYRFIKRLEDIIFSISILFFFIPILIIVVVLSIFFQGFPVFYVSKRYVSINKSIRIIKFRSMVRDAKSKKYDLHGKYMRDGYLDIPLSSNVYTKFGRFLEKSQFVELPQLFSVLFGKLSFIGNRPLPIENIKELRRKFPDKWEKRFDCPAGMTGISQVVGKYNLSASKRIELENLYSKVYTEGNVLKADTYIFFSTIILLILRDSIAYRSYDNAKAMLISCLKTR